MSKPNRQDIKARTTRSNKLQKALLEHYRHLVQGEAVRLRRKLPNEIPLEELVSAGIVGLKGAIDSLDSKIGVEFDAYCVLRIRRAILDDIRSRTWVPKIKKKGIKP
jgi:RNA polymerase sigma factor FliA